MLDPEPPGDHVGEVPGPVVVSVLEPPAQIIEGEAAAEIEKVLAVFT